MRRKNKIWASVCAFIATGCFMFGLTQLSVFSTVAAEASTVAGLQSASLDRIEPKKGVASDVDYIEFDDFSDDVWFLTQFTGKNVPNFAVNAKGGYATWNQDAWNATDGGAGIVLASTYEVNSANLYAAGGMVVANKVDTTSSHGTLNKNWSTITASTGDAPVGMSSLKENTEYVMILGWDRANGATEKGVSYYLYSVENGVLNEVGTYEFKVRTTTPTGSKAVIYGNIGNDATESSTGAETISFHYAQPAATLGDLLNGLSSDYAYKTQLMKEWNVSAAIGEQATLKAMDIASGSGNSLKAATGIESVSFDGLSGDTYFMVEFYGQNAPNFAVRSTKAYTEINCKTDADVGGSSNREEWSKAGILMLTSRANSWNDLYVQRGFCYNGGNVDAKNNLGGGASGKGPGYNYYTAGVHYVLIVGYDVVEGDANNTAKISYKVYTVAENTITLVNENSADYTGSTNALTGSTAVIYGNVKVNGSLGGDSVTFNYVKPQASMEALVMEMDDACLYKEQLIEEFAIETKTLTMTNSNQQVIGTKAVAADANYVLPVGKVANFVGWEYNGGLYAAGDSIAADGDISVQATCLDFGMLDGASIRLKIDENYNGGLRFTVKVKTAELAAFGDRVELHGVLIPTDMIDGDFEITEKDAKDIVLSKGIEKDDGYTYYYITLTNVLYSNYNREFSARAYAKVTYQDGETANVLLTDYSKEDNSRSIYDVAVMAYNKGEERNGVLEQYIGNTVNLAYSAGAEGNYELSVITDEDGLSNTSLRHYEIQSQSVSTENGVTTFTVTIKFNVSSLDLATTPVTLWEKGATVGTRMIKHIASVDTENNMVTCSFTIE